MKSVMQISKIVVALMIIGILSSCQSTKSTGTALSQLQPANPDEQAFYLSLTDLRDNISNSEWDQWLALYTDDAILTEGKRKVGKDEMRKVVEGISYKITDMEVLSQEISPDQAKVSVQFMGNGKKQFETYHYRKVDNKWLIYMETNP